MAEPVYLSGERIQGRSDDTVEVAATYTPSLSSSSGWTLTAGGGTASIASSELTLSADSSSDNSYATFDLGATLSDTAWLLTFTVEYSGWDNTTSGAGITSGVGVSSSATVTGQYPSGSVIEYLWEGHSSVGTNARAGVSGGSVGNRTNTMSAYPGVLASPYTDTQYVKLYRLTATTAKMEFYLNADYSDTPTTFNVTMGTTPAALRYFYFRLYYESGVGDSNTIVYSDIKLWNNSSSTTAARDKSSITNVPVGTRYEETDTRKIFRRTASAWVEKGTA